MRSPDTQKSIQLNINNALAANHKYIPEDRKKYLSQYARALMAPLVEHADDETLDFDPKDAVFILLSLALIMQSKVTNNTKIPMWATAALTYTDVNE